MSEQKKQGKRQVKLLSFSEINKLRLADDELPITMEEMKYYKRELMAIAWVCDCTRQEMMSLCNMLLPDYPERPDDYPSEEEIEMSDLANDVEPKPVVEAEPIAEPEPIAESEPVIEAEPVSKLKAVKKASVKKKTTAKKTTAKKTTAKKTTKK